jgi:hypothetical protein
MTLGTDFYTNQANNGSQFNILNGFGSSSWKHLSTQQALLVDITVAMINMTEPIVDDYNTLFTRRKSKLWFVKHKDEVFLSYFCSIVSLLRAWRHVNDDFDRQIEERFNSTYPNFYLRNFELAGQSPDSENFHMRVGKYWHDSLGEEGIRVKVPDFSFGTLHFSSKIKGIIAAIERLGDFGGNISPKALVQYFAQ